MDPAAHRVAQGKKAAASPEEACILPVITLRFRNFNFYKIVFLFL
jgi:hypothetical protein